MVVGKVEKEALRQLMGIRERGKLMMRVTTREVQLSVTGPSPYSVSVVSGIMIRSGSYDLE